MKLNNLSKKASSVNKDGKRRRKSKRQPKKQRNSLNKKVEISQDQNKRSQDRSIRKERSAMTWDEIAEWRRTWKPNPTKPGRWETIEHYEHLVRNY